jgi:TolB protein
MRRAWAIAAFGAIACVLGVAARAEATFPGANGEIAYSHGDGAVWEVNPNATNDHELIPYSGLTAPALTAPAWSPDGQLLALEGTPGGIFVADADGSSLRQLTNNPDRDPAWSPNGKRLVFSRLHHRIVSMRADGTDVRDVIRGARADDPSYSPDGRWIAYSDVRDPKTQNPIPPHAIYLVHPDGSGNHRITSRGNAWFPDWSPDGKHVVFASSRGLVVMRADGSGRRRLDVPASTTSNPSYSPNGRFIAFAESKGDGAVIATVKANGRDLHRLTPAARGRGDAAWRPLP